MERLRRQYEGARDVHAAVRRHWKTRQGDHDAAESASKGWSSSLVKWGLMGFHGIHIGPKGPKVLRAPGTRHWDPRALGLWLEAPRGLGP